VKVHLGGHLSFYEAQRRSNFEFHLSQPTPAIELIRGWGIPVGEVCLAAINSVLVDLNDAVVVDTDHLGLYPPIGGGTATGAGELALPDSVRKIVTALSFHGSLGGYGDEFDWPVATLVDGRQRDLRRTHPGGCDGCV
jgi:hypothetical protein